MKTISVLIKSGILGSILLLACASANADTINITVDENGHATSTDNILAGGIMGVEEWSSPAQQVNVLKYWIPETMPWYAIGTGVINIHEGSLAGPVSDVISFISQGGVWYLEFMSLDNHGSMADISAIPTGIPAADVDLVEGQTYTPGWGQPGCMYNDPYDTVTYTFLSDSEGPGTVPDSGATAMLLGMAFLGITALRRKLAV